jgi:hypothetical protein
MRLFRLFAFTVRPSRTSPNPAQIEGGSIRVTSQLRGLIDDSIYAADFASALSVAFLMDPQTRSNSTRDAVLSLAFDPARQALDAADELASSLSRSMDERSHPCLFIIAVLEERDRRAVTLWAFPRDEAFRFASRRGTHAIEILTDIFSRTSRLRKAALIEGRQLRNEFTTARVLDFQAGRSTDAVANYWTALFLLCTLAIASDTGTRLLARTITKAYDACDSAADKEQLFAGMVSIRTARRQRWSLADFADHYLSGDALDNFLRAAPNAESLASPFDFNRELFEQVVHFRVFQLESGVYVSSPPTEIGRSVHVTDDDEPLLTCSGRVVADKLRIRHG